MYSHLVAMCVSVSVSVPVPVPVPVSVFVSVTVFVCVAMCPARSHTPTWWVKSLTLENAVPLRQPTDPDDVYKVSDATRLLGLVVCRGTQVRASA